MFKKLRLRFMLLNLALLCLVFLVAFGCLGAALYSSNQRQIDFSLQTLQKAPESSLERGNPLTATSIVLDLNRDNTIRRRQTLLPLSAAEEAILQEQVIDSGQTRGKLVLNGAYYAYLRQPLANGSRIVMVDYTYYHKNMTAFTSRFGLAALFCLLALAAISFFWSGRAVRPLQKAFAQQRQFVADASHELKTPLAVIGADLALLGEHPEATVGAQQKWLDSLSSQVRRMGHLVNDLLTLARLDAAPPLHWGQVDFSRLIQGELLTFEGYAYEQQVTLTTADWASVTLPGDEEQLKRLVDILLDNAIKNSPAGATVQLALNQEQNKGVLTISNPCSPLSPDQITHLFDRFYRTDEARSRSDAGGYGLGLAIAKAIVEQHRGQISAACHQDRILFTVTLPGAAS